MKRNCVVWIGLVGLLVPVFVQAGEGRKWALLVGINNYRNLAHLRGAKNDVEAMADLLVGKFAFPEGQVFRLYNEKATRAEILRRFESELIEKVGEQDTAVFYFSGHGSKMRDISGDEPDGWDETLVPQDSREEGIFDISDDELQGLLAELSQRCHNVTFILDSCYSSSGQRSAVRMAPFDDRQPPGLVSRGYTDAGDDGLGRLDSENYVMIAACGTTETAAEIPAGNRIQGALTFNLVKILRGVEEETSWADIYPRLVGEVHRYADQTPQLHGNGSRVLFGIRGLARDPYIVVRAGGDSEVTLAGGKVHGLTEGSQFDIFVDGNIAGEPIGRVRLAEVKDDWARATIVDGGPVPGGAVAVERLHHYQGERLRLGFDGLAGSKKLAKVKKMLESTGEIEVATDRSTAQMVIVHDAQQGVMLLQRSSGEPLGPELSDKNIDAVVAAVVGTWVKWFRVLAIESFGPAIPSIDLRVKHQNEKSDNWAKGAEPIFQEGDSVVIQVVNRSHSLVYITILALSTSGEINELYPNGTGRQPFAPGKEVTLPPFEATLPPQVTSEMTIVKAFATLAPIDLSFLTQPGPPQHSSRSGVAPHPLERMLSPGSRAGDGPPARWTVTQIETEVRRKKRTR